MASKMCEFFWEHPVKFILRSFLSVVALCVLLTYMPKWFNALTGVVFLAVIIRWTTKWETQEENKQKKQKRVPMRDYEEMYAEYGDLVSRRIEELGVDKSHIHHNWLKTFHEYFRNVTRLCNRTKFTDFHIAACIIFSLVWYSDDIVHTDIIYKCIRELISKPRVYTIRITKGNAIILKVEQTLPEVNLVSIENEISSEAIAKIIKEIYIKNKNGKALMEFADFLKRLYLSCTRN